MDKIKIREFHQILLLIDENKHAVESVTATNLTFVLGDDSLRQFSLGDIIHCAIKIGTKLCDISLSIVSISKLGVEGRVLTSCTVYENFIKDYFSPEIQGVKLKKIASDKMIDSKAVWFYGDTEHEIYYKLNKTNIESFQITFKGRMVLFDGEVVTTGTIEEDDFDEKSKMSSKGSHIINTKETISKQMMENLIRYTEVCAGLDELHREQILAHIENRYKSDWDQ